mmetsp:Transcript_15011/g.22772  ORF Transcript_15011/g.22772 Transcript_15011/m.22772 type:complete len:214 (+) Transcript_15011:144-785(+)
MTPSFWCDDWIGLSTLRPVVSVPNLRIRSDSRPAGASLTISLARVTEDGTRSSRTPCTAISKSPTSSKLVIESPTWTTRTSLTLLSQANSTSTAPSCADFSSQTDTASGSERVVRITTSRAAPMSWLALVAEVTIVPLTARRKSPGKISASSAGVPGRTAVIVTSRRVFSSSIPTRLSPSRLQISTVLSSPTGRLDSLVNATAAGEMGGSSSA